MRMLLAAVVAAVIAAPSFAEDKTVTLNGDNTKITFVGTKPSGKHEGGFKTLKGTATVDGDALKKVEVTIETDSLYSDDAKLTGHLKSPDFFGVKANPTAKFVSTKIEKTDKGATITGDLTLNGKTKSVTFPATVTAKDGGLKLTSDFTIDKRDWGMTYGGNKISDDVPIKVAVDAK